MDSSKLKEKLFEIIFSGVLLLAFFLPWISFNGFMEFTGFSLPRAMQELGSVVSYFGGGDVPIEADALYFLYLIPILAIVVLVLSFLAKPTAVFAIIGGLIPYVALVYSLVEFGNELFQVSTIGVYLTLLAGLGLFLSGVGVLKIRKSSANQ